MEQTTWIKKDEIPLEKLEKVGIKRDFVGQMESQELKDFLNGFRSEIFGRLGRLSPEQPARARVAMAHTTRPLSGDPAR